MSKCSKYTEFFTLLFALSAATAAWAGSCAYRTLEPSSAQVRSALDPRNIAGAERLVGKTASFRGNVVKVYVSQSGKFAAIDFDKDYTKSLSAVAVGPAVKRLPGLETLAGRTILVRGTVILYHGQSEIRLDSPSQIRLVGPTAVSDKAHANGAG